MKKLITLTSVLLLVLTLSACGANTDTSEGGKDPGSNTDKKSELIMPSEMITLEDAESVLGMKMTVFGELDKFDNYDEHYKTGYAFDGTTNQTPYMFQVHSNGEKSSTSLDEIKKYYENRKDDWVEGVGDFAITFQDNLSTIHVYYKGYTFSVILTGKDSPRSDSEELVWKLEKLIEVSKLGVKRLDVLLK